LRLESPDKVWLPILQLGAFSRKVAKEGFGIVDSDSFAQCLLSFFYLHYSSFVHYHYFFFIFREMTARFCPK